MAPNPLMRRQMVTSKEPQEHQPEPVTPVMEEYAGVNNPWRGIEDHGVPSNNTPNPPGTMTDTRAGINYAPTPRDVDPIPVEIVNQFGREMRRMRVVTMVVNQDRDVQLCPRNDARIDIQIWNRSSANSVFLYHDHISTDQGIMMGFELIAQERITLTSQDAVYMVGQNVGMVKVQAIETYSIEL